jgi:hypothetical protein
MRFPASRLGENALLERTHPHPSPGPAPKVGGITIDRALLDRNLLGAALGDPSTWLAWLAILKAAHGRPLNERERELFTVVAGDREPPTRKVKELVCVASRRSGKGRIGAACAVHAALLIDHSPVLAPGEVGVVACVSPTRAQATILLNYAVGYLEASPLLRGEVVDVTADEVRLKNGNVICTLVSDYRSLRGRTLLLAIMDEAAFLRDEASSTPDIECARALSPGLATTGGMLVILSSPYRKLGLLYQRHRDHFGQNGDVLVIRAPSRLLNPTLDEGIIASAQDSDAFATRSEWLGEFRDDIGAFLDEELVERAIDHGRPLELPPQERCRYRAFVDASGGRHDYYCVSLGFKEGERYVVAVIRGARPPFDPGAVTTEFANLCREYGVGSVVGNSYSAEWVASAWRAAGIGYQPCDISKSEVYLEVLPLFTRGLVSMPDHKQLVRELRLLERHTHRSGRDSVDHGRNGSDDHSNAVCGLLRTLVARAPMRISESVRQWASIPQRGSLESGSGWRSLGRRAPLVVSSLARPYGGGFS